MIAPLRPGPDVVSSRVGQEVVLVDLRTDDILVLNGTGARIWELLAAGVDADAARRALLAEFAVDADQLDAELERFVDELRARKLLVPGDSAAGDAGP